MSALRDFVADLMDREGAAVETLEPDGLAVIAPTEVRAACGWPELARLGSGVELPAGAEGVPALYEIGGREYIALCAAEGESNPPIRIETGKPPEAPAQRSYLVFALPSKPR